MSDPTVRIFCHHGDDGDSAKFTNITWMVLGASGWLEPPASARSDAPEGQRTKGSAWSSLTLFGDDRDDRPMTQEEYSRAYPGKPSARRRHRFDCTVCGTPVVAKGETLYPILDALAAAHIEEISLAALDRRLRR